MRLAGWVQETDANQSRRCQRAVAKQLMLPCAANLARLIDAADDLDLIASAWHELERQIMPGNHAHEVGILQALVVPASLFGGAIARFLCPTQKLRG